MARPILVAGNWKMYMTVAEGRRFVTELEKAGPPPASVRVVLFAPYTALHALQGLSGFVQLGAQNLHPEPQGAFTGEISAPMLAELVPWVLVGHSERREIFGESDELVCRKLHAALAHGLQPVLCVGETLPEREGGRTTTKLRTQLDAGLAGMEASAVSRLVIAYEPIWAIGTGRNATPGQAQEAHHFIKEQLRGRYGLAVPVLYGGSVKPDNCAALLAQPDVDGLLVGGASLKADSFSAIISHSVTASR